MKMFLRIFVAFVLWQSTAPIVVYAQSRRECLDFLYMTMALPDSVDYTRSYWKKQTKCAIRARRKMKWGHDVPKWEFKHFVLPPRVNNEALDNAREVIYKELAPRLNGMTMEQAVLEVNHWCHERVSYRPSDGRTSPPLATMANAIGRCGEESTFTVAALRSVGIPARQVYCPRWAHTDDNHAWVEVWVDGKWRFMGACEPEAVLDKGWFNWAASRAMLVRAYDEEGDEIPTTGTYAPTKTVNVTVVNSNGKPIEGAKVDFRIYNYSEFYPLNTIVTGGDGKASFTTGYGDLLVWVSHGSNNYAYKKVDYNATDVNVVLEDHVALQWEDDIDIHVPVSALEEPDRSIVDTVSPNGRRLLVEDSIRTDYQQRMFYHGNDELLKKARSNWRVIQKFVRNDDPKTALVISGLSEKDLRDVTIDVLRDACLMPDAGLESGGVRVSTEPLRPYVSFLSRRLPVMNAAEWIEWVDRNISLCDSRNPRQLPMSVVGVYKNRRCDARSRELFTVAGARVLGLKAELNAVGKAVVEGLSLPVRGELPVEKTGTLKLEVSPHTMYYHGYTVSRLVDGRPVSLDYADDDPTVTQKFREGLQLPSGAYILTIGTRLKGGDVLSRMKMVWLNPGETLTLPVIPRYSERAVLQDLQLEDSERKPNATSIQSAQ